MRPYNWLATVLRLQKKCEYKVFFNRYHGTYAYCKTDAAFFGGDKPLCGKHFGQIHLVDHMSAGSGQAAPTPITPIENQPRQPGSTVFPEISPGRMVNIHNLAVSVMGAMGEDGQAPIMPPDQPVEEESKKTIPMFERTRRGIDL